MAFNEDACRIRKDFAPENLAVVRPIALNLLTKENTFKLGIKNKRLRAGWDADLRDEFSFMEFLKPRLKLTFGYVQSLHS